MGLTAASVGMKAVDSGLKIKKENPRDKIIALAGNPNVGKSTVFNALTGMKQHTGNWPGKTVSNAKGECVHNGINYIMVDLPGTYSLAAHSNEEEVAAEFISYGNADAVIVVCDATCLERNLNLVLQTIEITDNVIVCINLIDEARKKKIDINSKLLSKRLGVPVIETEARKKKGLCELLSSVENINNKGKNIHQVRYLKPVEEAIEAIQKELPDNSSIKKRQLALNLLQEKNFEKISTYLEKQNIKKAVFNAWSILNENNITPERLEDIIASCTVLRAEEICMGVVTFNDEKYSRKDRTADKILTSRITGIPIMIVLLALVFWLTITGANYPSEWLSKILFGFQEILLKLCVKTGVPEFIYNPMIYGVYHVLAWIVSVMLPPMAIFFPMFTILEDLGYLPRVAFNMDKIFKKCHACGKQALTMCMGFGCNAAGVVGCRIIDSPRERLIAILTNSFVPCNGRFPSLIAVITVFFVFSGEGIKSQIISTAVLTLVVLLGIFMTFIVSFFLSKTFLRGEPSSFTLELPPYRKPQIFQVIVRSIFDRTVFVLGRAVCTAAPAGLIIWLFANITVGDITLLSYCSSFLNPFAQLMGLDGVILFAFILGIPANEIVVPIIIMAYLMSEKICPMSDILQLKELLLQNGWTWATAASFLIFSLFHWPCATTLLTIKKETGSIKWTVLSFILPAAVGVLMCMLFTAAVSLII